MMPRDFSVGIVDFFAALLPGAIATWLALQYVDPADLRHWSIAIAVSNELVHGAALFLSSYILGHFVFLVGAALDPLYDQWRARAHPRGSDPTYQAADTLRRDLSWQLGPTEAKGALTTLKWARTYVLIHAPEARVEIDGFEANSKFFRSLVIIFGALSMHFLLREQQLGLAVASAILGSLSFWRFRDQRWKYSELTFATAVIVRTRSDKAKTEVRSAELLCARSEIPTDSMSK